MNTTFEWLNYPDRKSCCIHAVGSSDLEEKCSVLSGIESWKTLKEAAVVRQYQPILHLCQTNEKANIPTLHYHRKCRSLFTLKKSLDSIRAVGRKRKSVDAEDDLSVKPKRTPSKEANLEKLCIFCDKKKYQKGKDSREPLAQCVTFGADDKIRQAALRKSDRRLLAIISQDMVAQEAHYHKSCYREYTCRETSQECDTVYLDIEREKFEELFNFIRASIFCHKQVASIEHLLSKMKTLWPDSPALKDSTKKKIYSQLKAEFGDKLNFSHDHQGKVIVYPDTLLIEDILKENSQLKAEIQSHMKESYTISDFVKLLRSEIQSYPQDNSWPPDMENLNMNMSSPPPTLFTLLQGVICGCDNLVSPKQSVFIKSIIQDILYVSSGGKRTTPKHILLPFMVKGLTGNNELVTVLNRLGHSRSLTSMDELETALCKKKLENQSADVALPKQIQPGIIVNLAFDNIDRLEETLSGSGTTHRVNGIVVQRKVYGPQLPSTGTSVHRSKQKSLQITDKPLDIYVRGVRRGPDTLIDCESLITSKAFTESVKENLIWALARDTMDIPSWTGFNILTRQNKNVLGDNVGYLPPIDAPATQLNTVNEIMQRTLKIMEQLNLPFVLSTMDQALYAKACEVKWKSPEIFRNVILRMGDFHTLCNFLSTIGKRFQNTGLKDLAVETGIIAEGSIQSVLDGKHYNRGMRLHKITYEALLHLAWKQFLNWNTDQMSSSELESALACLNTISCVTPETYSLIMSDGTVHNLLGQFNNYLALMREGKFGPLQQFWCSYIDMVNVLLGLVRASRESNIELHLYCIHEIISWSFAYDKLNYARYLPVYLSDMLQAISSRPELASFFATGGLSAQLSDTNPFGRIPFDQTIEETANKDTKISGGTTKFSLNANKVNRHFLTMEYRSAAIHQLREFTCSSDANNLHPDLHKTKWKKDTELVQSIKDLLETSWINPMDSHNSELVCLSSGRVAPDAIKDDLLTAKEKGATAFLAFVTQNTDPSATFYQKMTKQKLKTFGDLHAGKTAKSGKGKEVILEKDRNLFGHMLLVAQSRNLDLETVLSYPLGTLPWSLSNTDGSIRKTTKSSLSKALYETVSPVTAPTESSATIIDGMSLLHRVKADNRSFEEISQLAFKMTLSYTLHSQRVDFVLDKYKEISIKSGERENRGSSSGLEFKHLKPGHKITSWAKFLSSGTSKEQLVLFLSEQWKKQDYTSQLTDKVVYLTVGDLCIRYSKHGWEEYENLRCTHEEADTRMFIHCKDALIDHQVAIIASEDTDVLIIGLSIALQFLPKRLIQMTSTAGHSIYHDVTGIASHLGDKLCKSLVGYHAFSGNDAVSAFLGRGKISGFKLLKKTNKFQDAFSQLGIQEHVTRETLASVQEFTCQMYIPNTKLLSVNKARYVLFTSKRGEVDSSQLPPCENALSLHIERANFVAKIWRECLVRTPEPLDPTKHGWKFQDGKLVVSWLTCAPAPQSVLELLNCNCRRSCKESCPCRQNNLPCSPTCHIKFACTNTVIEADTVREDSSDEE